MALGWLLFGKGARHLTAEMLYEEATHAKVPVSLATVYNTLNQLTDAGLLRQVSVDGTKTYFDTNVTSHHHFYLENSHELVDIHDPHLVLEKMPEVPEGYEISRVDMTKTTASLSGEGEACPRRHFWQVGHQNVERPFCTKRLTVPRQPRVWHFSSSRS